MKQVGFLSMIYDDYDQPSKYTKAIMYVQNNNNKPQKTDIILYLQTLKECHPPIRRSNKSLYLD